jgi:hypothetical protein
MMPNYLKINPVKKRKVSIQSFEMGMNAEKDESILPLSVAKKIYNFDFSSGALREGYGLERAPGSDSAKNVWIYKRHDFESGADEEIFYVLRL